jgi:transcription initiation factor TFIIH subunit 3
MADFRIRPADDPPSFLAVIIDADVESWIPSQTGVRTPDESCRALENVVEQVLVFLNTFILLHQHNRVAIILFGRHGVRVAYPCFADAVDAARDPDAAGLEDDAFDPASASANAAAGTDPDGLLRSVRAAIATALADAFTAQAAGHMQGRKPHVSAALATALCLINRRRHHRLANAGIADLAANSTDLAALSDATRHAVVDGEARILTVLAGLDVPEQYIPVMNCIFSAQRIGVLMDTCMLHPDRDSIFFQQAAHLTKGVYLRPHKLSSEAPESLLQYLMTAFLADSQCREFLSMPLQGEVDFRATCFVTRNPVSEGYTCSVCLSTFDVSVGKKAISCPTCHARFAAAVARPPPRLLPRVPSARVLGNEHSKSKQTA